jgi:hypothetical protein
MVRTHSTVDSSIGQEVSLYPPRSDQILEMDSAVIHTFLAPTRGTGIYLLQFLWKQRKLES